MGKPILQNGIGIGLKMNGIVAGVEEKHSKINGNTIKRMPY